MAILGGAAFAAIAELMLRICSVGTHASLVIQAPPEVTARNPEWTHQFNPLSDVVYYGLTDLSGPEPRPFRIPKPESTFRIVVLGESTVIGFPYASELAFPRHLELQLQAQNPDRRIEVLNAGITAINSFALADLVGQCFEADPDLIIVHAGHNEFYGPGGPGSTALSLPPRILRSAFSLRRLRLVQLVTGITQQQPPQDDLLNSLPKSLEIPMQSPVFAQAHINFRDNLRRIAELCNAEGVPLLLSPVACNLRDQSPMLPLWPEEARMVRGECSELLEHAAELMERNKAQDALILLHRAESLVPDFADISFRIGQCLNALRRHDEAGQAFSRARDLDACRFRIPSSFYEVARTAIPPGSTSRYFDLNQALRDAFAGDTPGDNLFLEHVHYSFEGHYLVGKLMAQEIQKEWLEKTWNDAAAVTIEDARIRLGFLTEDDLAAAGFAIQVLETGPFSRCADLELQKKRLLQRTSKLLSTLSEERKNVFLDLHFTQMSEDLPGHLLSNQPAVGDLSFSAELQRCITARTPWKAKGEPSKN